MIYMRWVGNDAAKDLMLNHNWQEDFRCGAKVRPYGDGFKVSIVGVRDDEPVVCSTQEEAMELAIGLVKLLYGD